MGAVLTNYQEESSKYETEQGLQINQRKNRQEGILSTVKARDRIKIQRTYRYFKGGLKNDGSG